MTAEPRTGHTNRRTVLTTTAAVAGAAVGATALAACGTDEGAQGDSGASSSAPDPSVQPGESLASLKDVPVGGAASVTTPDGAKAIVSRKSESEVTAFSAVCTHQGCTVKPEGADLTCPCHGSVFDAFTGEVKDGPAETSLPAIEVKVDGDSVVTA